MYKIIYWSLSLSLFIYGQNLNSKKDIQNQLKNIGISQSEIQKIIDTKNPDILLPDEFIEKKKTSNINENIQDDLNALYNEEKSNSIEINKIPIKNSKDVFKEKFISKLDSKSDTVDTLGNEENFSSPYFGYDIFKGNPELFQASINETIDPNYIVGPGDELIIMLWGETEFTSSYIVSRDGYLFIDNIGQVFVNGLDLEKLEVKLFRILKKVYSSLDNSKAKATTFFDVSLGSLVLRPIRIFALGEVNQPGAYSVKSSTSLFTSLYYFNGPTEMGSLRNIQLIRKGELINEIDFYDYLLTGKQINDIRLQRDDVVFIPQRGKTISVIGEVNRAEIFELKEDENLIDLIDIAGGVKNTTHMERIQIDRILPANQRKITGVDKTIIDLNLRKIIDSNKNFELFDGDTITFFNILGKRFNTVSIENQVNRPGTYELKPGMTIKDLINISEGLIIDTYMERADIIRIDGKDNRTIHLDINLQKAIDGDFSNNIMLESNDKVILYNKSSMLYETDLNIEGHVFNPGRKPFRSGMKVIDLIWLGGGFKNELHLSDTYFKKAELYRFDADKVNKFSIPFRLDSVLEGKSIAKMKLEMGDEIRIFSNNEILGLKQQNVTIEGNVKRPGPYSYIKDMKLSELLFRAGGFKDDEYVKTIFMERMDIIRLDENQKSKKIISFNLNEVFDTTNNIDPILERGDFVRIYSSEMFNLYPKVSIKGEVEKPGIYELKNGMLLKDLILEAGGVSVDIFRYRAEIARIDPYNLDLASYSIIKTIDLNNTDKIYKINSKNKDSEKVSFPLKDFDVITIRPDPYFRKQKSVSVQGFVYYPGDYVLSHPGELVTDIIERAGGLRPEAYARSGRLIRGDEVINLSFNKIIRYPRSKDNFELAEGDSIKIGSKPNLVKIEGEVNSPGNYQYFEGKNINDYINIAGGITKNASKYSTYVRYPDGTSDRIQLFKWSPKVYDGSTIVVVSKEVVEPFSFTDYVTNITSIWADVTQAWLMIILASRGSS